MTEEDEDMKIEVGRRLRGLREKAGLTGAYVAGMIGVDQSNYSKIEGGLVRLQVPAAVVLCELYDVDLDYIFRGVTD